MFGLQAVINLGVVMDALPTTGLPLPFVSFGGSTLVVDLFAMGILLNISRGAPEPARPSVAPPVRRASGARRLPGGGRRITVEV
jgi:cell division protein FtsW